MSYTYNIPIWKSGQIRIMHRQFMDYYFGSGYYLEKDNEGHASEIKYLIEIENDHDYHEAFNAIVGIDSDF